MIEMPKTSKGGKTKGADGGDINNPSIEIDDLPQLIDDKAKKCLCEHILRALKKEGVKPNKPDNSDISCNRANVIITKIEDLQLSPLMQTILEKEIDFNFANKQYQQIFENFLKDPSIDTLKTATKQLVNLLDFADNLHSYGISNETINKFISSTQGDWSERFDKLRMVEDILKKPLEGYPIESINLLIDNCIGKSGGISLNEFDRLSQVVYCFGVKQDATKDAVENLLSNTLNGITVTLGNPQRTERLSSKILGEFFANNLPIGQITKEITPEAINNSLFKLVRDFNIKTKDSDGNHTEGFQELCKIAKTVYGVFKNISKTNFDKLYVGSTNKLISSILKLENSISEISRLQDVKNKAPYSHLNPADFTLVPDRLSKLYKHVYDIYSLANNHNPPIEITGMTNWIESFNEQIRKFRPENREDLLASHLSGFVYEADRVRMLFRECQQNGETLLSIDVGRKYHCLISNQNSSYYNKIVNGELDITYRTALSKNDSPRERYIEIKASINAARESLAKGQFEKLMCIFTSTGKLNGGFEVLINSDNRSVIAFDEFVNNNDKLNRLLSKLFPNVDVRELRARCMHSAYK